MMIIFLKEQTIVKKNLSHIKFMKLTYHKIGGTTFIKYIFIMEYALSKLKMLQINEQNLQLLPKFIMVINLYFT